MEVKTGKLKTEEILKVNAGISEIQSMSLEADIMMDLGIIKASCETVVKNYNKAINAGRIKILKDLKIEEGQKISALQRADMDQQVEELTEKLLVKEYDVDYPFFSRKEIKSWIESAKDDKDDPKAFRPSTIFFTNMVNFISK